jgi:hypothetical protein
VASSAANAIGKPEEAQAKQKPCPHDWLNFSLLQTPAAVRKGEETASETKSK